MRVALVDYDSGNLHSAQKAFALMGSQTGAEIVVTSDPEVVLRADRIGLPGDGAFPACKAALEAVPGMVDKDGYLWRGQIDTATHASGEEIEKESRAQSERALAKGPRPGHIDTHMGTLFVKIDYTKAYLKLAEEYHIPAMVIEQTPAVTAKFRKQGYPITEESLKAIAAYKLPKLDDFNSAPDGKTYEDKKQKFQELVRSLSPGLNEIIFHPSVLTDTLKAVETAVDLTLEQLEAEKSA